MSIFDAIDTADLDMVKTLLTEKPMLVIAIDSDGLTPAGYIAEKIRKAETTLKNRIKKDPNSPSIEKSKTLIANFNSIAQAIKDCTQIYETQSKKSEAKLMSALSEYSLFEATSAERSGAAVAELFRCQQNLNQIQSAREAAHASNDFNTARAIQALARYCRFRCLCSYTITSKKKRGCIRQHNTTPTPN